MTTPPTKTHVATETQARIIAGLPVGASIVLEKSESRVLGYCSICREWWTVFTHWYSKTGRRVCSECAVKLEKGQVSV